GGVRSAPSGPRRGPPSGLLTSRVLRYSRPVSAQRMRGPREVEMVLIDSQIEEFWKKTSKQERDALTTGEPVLFLGNGITRLAESERELVSWHGWVQECWERIRPPLTFEYAVRRGLTLPECITYLQDYLDQGRGPKNSDLRKFIYKSLWETTE